MLIKQASNTLAIGGLMRQDVGDNYTVPLMGDAPIIGSFFRSKSLNQNEGAIF